MDSTTENNLKGYELKQPDSDTDRILTTPAAKQIS